jgi:hypothetical protein
MRSPKSYVRKRTSRCMASPRSQLYKLHAVINEPNSRWDLYSQTHFALLRHGALSLPGQGPAQKCARTRACRRVEVIFLQLRFIENLFILTFMSETQMSTCPYQHINAAGTARS